MRPRDDVAETLDRRARLARFPCCPRSSSRTSQLIAQPNSSTGWPVAGCVPCNAMNQTQPCSRHGFFKSGQTLPLAWPIMASPRRRRPSGPDIPFRDRRQRSPQIRTGIVFDVSGGDRAHRLLVLVEALEFQLRDLAQALEEFLEGLATSSTLATPPKSQNAIASGPFRPGSPRPSTTLTRSRATTPAEPLSTS